MRKRKNGSEKIEICKKEKEKLLRSSMKIISGLLEGLNERKLGEMSLTQNTSLKHSDPRVEQQVLRIISRILLQEEDYQNYLSGICLKMRIKANLKNWIQQHDYKDVQNLMKKLSLIQKNRRLKKELVNWAIKSYIKQNQLEFLFDKSTSIILKIKTRYRILLSFFRLQNGKQRMRHQNDQDTQTILQKLEQDFHKYILDFEKKPLTYHQIDEMAKQKEASMPSSTSESPINESNIDVESDPTSSELQKSNNTESPLNKDQAKIHQSGLRNNSDPFKVNDGQVYYMHYMQSNHSHQND